MRGEVVRLSYSEHFRRHGVESTFRSDSVKDDLFIREDILSKYSITTTTTTRNINTPTTLPTTSSVNKLEL